MYLVLTKEEFGEGYDLTKCETTDEVKDAVLAGTRTGREVIVAQPCEFSVEVKVKDQLPKLPDRQPAPVKRGKDKDKQEEKVESLESGSPEDQGPGDSGNSPV